MRLSLHAAIAVMAFVLLSACATDDTTRQALVEALNSIQRVADTVNEELAAARKKLDDTGTETGTDSSLTVQADAASQAPVVHYGHETNRWTTVGISPFRGVTSSIVHRPAGYEIAYGIAQNEGIDIAGARTREQQAIRFRQAADELDRYVSTFRSRLLTVFDAPPVVRIDRENEAWADIALTAIQSVNTALPDAFKMLLAEGGTGMAQDGEIVIDFHPKANWPTPAYGRVAGRTEFPTLEWIPGDRANSKYGAHIWVDTDFMEQSSDRHARALIVHELMHALGLDGHLDAVQFPATITQAVINTGENTPKQSLYAVDRHGLFAIYSDVSAEDLGEWSRDAVRIEAYMLGQDSSQFGAQSMNGLASAWAAIRENAGDFGAWARTSSLGSATWTGRILGLTPDVAAVSGTARLILDLSDMDGTMAFTGLETWVAGAPLGADGSGTTWGDGDLHYSIAVEGKTFRQTGGDDGIVTGAFGGSAFRTMGGTVDRYDLDAAFSGRR